METTHSGCHKWEGYAHHFTNTRYHHCYSKSRVHLGIDSLKTLQEDAHGAMGRRIDPSWGGPIEQFLVPASAPRLVYQRPWYVLSCLWDGAYKRTLAVNQKE